MSKKLKKKKITLPKNMTIGRLKKLFQMFCVHTIEYETDTYSDSTWRGCSECLLCELDYEKTVSSRKSLCFAIWNERILKNA